MTILAHVGSTFHGRKMLAAVNPSSITLRTAADIDTGPGGRARLASTTIATTKKGHVREIRSGPPKRCSVVERALGNANSCTAISSRFFNRL
jgi:hypothetical protein